MWDLEIEGNIEGWINKKLNIQHEQKPTEILRYIIPNGPLSVHPKSQQTSKDIILWTESPEVGTWEETLRSYVYLQRKREAEKEEYRTWWKRIEKDIDFLVGMMVYLFVFVMIIVCCICWWRGT